MAQEKKPADLVVTRCTSGFGYHIKPVTQKGMDSMTEYFGPNLVQLNKEAHVDPGMMVLFTMLAASDEHFIDMGIDYAQLELPPFDPNLN